MAEDENVDVMSMNDELAERLGVATSKDMPAATGRRSPQFASIAKLKARAQAANRNKAANISPPSSAASSRSTSPLLEESVEVPDDLHPFLHMLPPEALCATAGDQQLLYAAILEVGMKCYYHLMHYSVVYASESATNSTTSLDTLSMIPIPFKKRIAVAEAAAEAATDPDAPDIPVAVAVPEHDDSCRSVHHHSSLSEGADHGQPSYSADIIEELITFLSDPSLRAQVHNPAIMERIDHSYETLIELGDSPVSADPNIPEPTPQIAANTLGLFTHAAMRRPPTRAVEHMMAQSQESTTAHSDMPELYDPTIPCTMDEFQASEDSLIMLAASSGFAVLLHLMVSIRGSTAFAGDTDCSPLMEACAAGALDVVRILVSAGADVGAISATHNTALIYASAAGHEECVRLLLGSPGCNIEQRNENGHCALMEAASGGHLGIVTMLILSGAKPVFVNMNSDFKESPLTLASYKGHVQVVEYLLEVSKGKGSLPPSEEEMHTALMETSMDGHVEVARVLLNAGAAVNMTSESYESPLTLACCGGHDVLAKMLLEAGAYIEEPNDESYTPLMEAAREGHLAVVKVLLERGAQVNAQTEETGETALTVAACGGYTDVLELLVQHGGDLELGANTPLMEAAQEGHVATVMYILGTSTKGEGRCPNLQAHSDTALALAAENGHLDVLEVLFTAGANIELECEGRTPLMKAAKNGYTDIVTFLIAKQANVNYRSSDNDSTALSLACAAGHKEIVRNLLRAGADPNVELKDGVTCVQEAAKNGFVEIVELMLDHNGAYPQPPRSTPSGRADGAAAATAAGSMNMSGQTANNAFQQAQKVPSGSLCSSTCSTATSRRNKNKKQHQQNSNVASGCPKHCKSKRCAMANIRAEMMKDAPTPTAASCSTSSVSSSSTQCRTRYSRSYCSSDTSCNSSTTDVTSDVPEDPSTLLKAAVEGYASPEWARAYYAWLANLYNIKKAQLKPTPPPVPISLDLPADCNIADILRKVEDLQKTLLQMAPGLGCYPVPASVTPAGIVGTSATGGPVGFTQVPIDQASMIYPKELVASGQNLGEYMRSRTGIDTTYMDDASLNQAALELHKQLSGSAADMQALANFAAVNDTMQWVHQTGLPKELIPSTSAVLTASLQTTPAASVAAVSRTPPPASSVAKSAPFAAPLSAPSTASKKSTTSNSAAAAAATPLVNPVVPTTSGSYLSSTYEAKKKSLGGLPLPGTVTNSQKKSASVATSTTSSTGSSNATPAAPSVAHASTSTPSTSCSRKAAASATATQFFEKYMNSGASLPDVDIQQFQQLMASLPPDQRVNPMKKIQELFANKQMGPHEYNRLVSNNADATTAKGVMEQQTAALNETLKVLRPTVTSLPGGMVAAAPPASSVFSAHHLSSFSQTCAAATNTHHHHHHGQQTSGQQHSQQTSTSAHRRTHSEGDDLDTPRAPASQRAAFNVDAATDSNNDTPLTLACSNGHTDMVSVLVSRGANIEHKDKKGFTPLILAATGGHVAVVEALLDKGANIEAQSERTKDTALSLACSGGRKEVVELLINRGANKEHRNVSDYTPLSLAASGGYVEIVNMLLNAGAEINSRTGSKLGISPLMLAAMNGHKEATRVLLEQGSDINAQIETNRNTALTLACFQGRTDVVKLLLQYNANVEHRAKTGLTPLMEAANGGYVEVGELLLLHNADPNTTPVPSSRDTALTIAADKGHDKFVEMLVHRGAQIDSRNKKGCTALWLACHGGHLETVQMLVNHNADVDSQDNRKVSPLMIAFRKGHVKVVKYIVDYVKQFPNDQEMSRYLTTITSSGAETVAEPQHLPPPPQKRNQAAMQQQPQTPLPTVQDAKNAKEAKDLLRLCEDCYAIISQAKNAQAEQANKAAESLLAELELEEAQARTKKQKKQQKKEKKTKKGGKKDGVEASVSPAPEDPSTETATETKAVVSSTSSATVATPVTSSEKMDTDKKEESEDESDDELTKSMTVLTRLAKSLSSMKPPSESASARLGNNSSPVPHEQQRALTESEGEPVTPVMNARQKRQMGRRARKDSGSAVSTPPNTHQQNAIVSLVMPMQSPIPPPKPSPQGEEWVKASKKNNSRKAASSSVVTPLTGRDYCADENGAYGGWKDVELSRRRSNTLSVCSSVIARVIGRAGANINAIREATGASIEVEKQGVRRDIHDRHIFIRGTQETCRNATLMINGLIADTDTTVNDIIRQVLRGNTSVASSSSESGSRVGSSAAADRTYSITTNNPNSAGISASSAGSAIITTTSSERSGGAGAKVPPPPATTNVWQQRMAARQQQQQQQQTQPAAKESTPPPTVAAAVPTAICPPTSTAAVASPSAAAPAPAPSTTVPQQRVTTTVVSVPPAVVPRAVEVPSNSVPEAVKETPHPAPVALPKNTFVPVKRTPSPPSAMAAPSEEELRKAPGYRPQQQAARASASTSAATESPSNIQWQSPSSPVKPEPIKASSTVPVAPISVSTIMPEITSPIVSTADIMMQFPAAAIISKHDSTDSALTFSSQHDTTIFDEETTHARLSRIWSTADGDAQEPAWSSQLMLNNFRNMSMGASDWSGNSDTFFGINASPTKMMVQQQQQQQMQQSQQPPLTQQVIGMSSVSNMSSPSSVITSVVGVSSSASAPPQSVTSSSHQQQISAAGDWMAPGSKTTSTATSNANYGKPPQMSQQQLLSRTVPLVTSSGSMPMPRYPMQPKHHQVVPPSVLHQQQTSQSGTPTPENLFNKLAAQILTHQGVGGSSGASHPQHPQYYASGVSHPAAYDSAIVGMGHVQPKSYAASFQSATQEFEHLSNVLHSFHGSHHHQQQQQNNGDYATNGFSTTSVPRSMMPRGVSVPSAASYAPPPGFGGVAPPHPPGMTGAGANTTVPPPSMRPPFFNQVPPPPPGTVNAQQQHASAFNVYNSLPKNGSSSSTGSSSWPQQHPQHPPKSQQNGSGGVAGSQQHPVPHMQWGGGWN